MSGAVASLRWHVRPRRVADRARLALARALHAVAEALATAACRVAPRWERDQ